MKIVFDLLSNIWFYVGISAFLILIYFFPGVNLIAGIRLPSLPNLARANTQIAENIAYFPQRVVSNTIVGITYASMDIAQGTKELSFSQERSYENEYEALIGIEQELRLHAGIPLQDLLANSSDRQESLQAYIDELQGLVFRANDVLGLIRSQLNELERENTACTSNKEQADRAYNQAISEGQVATIDSILQQAQEYAACQSRTRIIINSYVPPSQQLSLTAERVQAYIDVLVEHKATLAQYYELFDDSVLEDILRAKNDLGL